MAKPNDYPGMTPFQRQYGGKPFSGNSGILPFYKTREGHIRTPAGPTGTVFQKK